MESCPGARFGGCMVRLCGVFFTDRPRNPPGDSREASNMDSFACCRSTSRCGGSVEAFGKGISIIDGPGPGCCNPRRCSPSTEMPLGGPPGGAKGGGAGPAKRLTLPPPRGRCENGGGPCPGMGIAPGPAGGDPTCSGMEGTTPGPVGGAGAFTDWLGPGPGGGGALLPNLSCG